MKRSMKVEEIGGIIFRNIEDSAFLFLPVKRFQIRKEFPFYSTK